MKTYRPSELVRFLDAVDRHLEGPVERTLIGGVAACLAHGVDSATKDIDTFEGGGPSEARLQRAVSRAHTATGLAIPFGPAGVADAPQDFETRLVPVLRARRWKRLTLHALERHDLALSKIVRGVQGDLEHIAAIHRHRPLDLDTLVARYEGEMGHVIARVDSLRLSFLWCVEELFGELARDDVAERIGAG
jgi:hypothetical protein